MAGMKRKPISVRNSRRYRRERYVEPDEFKEGSFRMLKLSSGKRVIIGRKKGSQKASLQAILKPRRK